MSKKKKFNYSRDEILEEVKKDSKIGKMFVETEMTFLRAVASGKIYEVLEKEV